MSLFGFEVTGPVVLLGAITGMTYGLLAVGLVLVYRTSKVINFAHGEIGVFAAAVFGLLVGQYGLPYYLVLPAALALAAAVGAGSEIVVIRRLRKAPRLMSIVATLGIGQFLLWLSLTVNAQVHAGSVFPQPPGLPTFDVGGALRVTEAYGAMLVLSPPLVIALALFLARTRAGLAIRGAAANAELARLSGVFSARMSSLSWAIAGLVSGFTAILYIPSLGFVSGQIVGPGLLLRALAAGVIARMTSLPVALAAGLGVGIVEQALLWNNPRGGLVEMTLFVLILVALLAQRRRFAGREEEKGSWAAVQPWRPLPDVYRRVRAIRLLPVAAAGTGFALLVGIPWLVSHSAAIDLISLLAFAIVGLSVWLITGLGGQLSLGQFALAAIGATVSFWVSSRTGNFVLAFAYAGIAAAFASLVIGLPALRIRGLMLTVTTLSFALATPAWLLHQPWMLGDGVDPGRPIVAGHALTTVRSYYFVVVLTLVVALWLVWNVRRSGIGRQLLAVRDNEQNARAFTVRAAGVKVQGFMLAGFIAGLGGAAYGHALSNISALAFPLDINITVVAMAVIGGIGMLAGSLLGAIYIVGIPAFLPLDSAGMAATHLGWLLLILYAPGGITQILEPVRDRFADRLARRAGLDVDAARAGEDKADDTLPVVTSVAGPARRNGQHRPVGVELLRVNDIRRSYGGVKAVDGVSLSVTAGETFGLIGPNGAGKTTLFELIGGFTPAESGQVLFDGIDITHLGPEDRAHLGLIRSFQDAALFPTLSVLDTLKLACEKAVPTRFFSSLVGLPAGERERTERARELVAFFGLERYRDKAIRELSTGTRRITELACLVALEPRLLLLDEPSSGIAQRETEALGALLGDIKRQLDVTMVLIEHDIPLVMGLADRILVMDAGKTIAQGPPVIVQHDPRVVEAYLGGSSTAIQRSGVLAGDGALDGIPGIGPAKRAALLAAFGSVDALRTASLDELTDVPGISRALAARVHDALEGSWTVTG